MHLGKAAEVLLMRKGLDEIFLFFFFLFIAVVFQCENCEIIRNGLKLRTVSDFFPPVFKSYFLNLFVSTQF